MPDGQPGPTLIEEGSGRFCRAVLDDLPDWFGIPEAVDHYCDRANHLAAFGISRDGEPVGIVTLVRATDATMEIDVMGVRPAWHGQGLGRALIEAAAGHARSQGARLLSVMTVGAAHPSQAYAATRAFYRAVGFLPVEEFADLWGPGMPALLFVRPV
jgi:GNAT superfamily N-acetyltransferase